MTVCLNAEQKISNAIKSVLNQTYQKLEYIIIDGGSTDSTLKIIEEFQSIRSINLITEKDNGVYDAMNKAINMSSGDWIYFLGSDDIFINDSIISNIFDNNFDVTSQLIYGNVIFNHSGLRYDGKFDSVKLSEKNICHQSIFYHKDLFKLFGLFDLKYRICSDHVFNLKCFGSKLNIKYLDIDIAIFNELGISGTVIDEQFVKDFDQLLVDNHIVCEKSFSWLIKQNYQIKNSYSFQLAKILAYPFNLLKKINVWVLQKF